MERTRAPRKCSLPGILRMASQYMTVLRLVMIQITRIRIVGTSQPASANIFGSCGTPGPVMLLMRSAMPAKYEMFFPPKPFVASSFSSIKLRPRCILLAVSNRLTWSFAAVYGVVSARGGATFEGVLTTAWALWLINRSLSDRCGRELFGDARVLS